MWQDIRLTNPSGHNQFLGDMFEGFLDQGVKQSEGQYFTPMPICRFILMSLPLESLIKDNATPPKAIDYACGAGHFLNELAIQIKPLVEQHKPKANLVDYHKAIVGVEKEYRLSKVAKVSAFMYGQQDIKICYGDALINQHAAFPDIKDNSFDLLVANPPYSVRGFLETLPEEERSAYGLTDTIDNLDTNNSIEAFFIERAKQLLKAGGVAAVILPSSILSNGNRTYVKAREILLQYFDIVAIAEFSSGTFGKTGTNTVTLFLRRKKTTPDTAEHYKERVAQWFAVDEQQAVYEDEYLIDRYAEHIGIAPADYKALLAGNAQGAWCEHTMFVEYTKAFNNNAEIKKLRTQKKFSALSEVEQNAEIEKRYMDFVQTIERDKLYHFVMASDQPNPVLIIRSPNDSKAIKKFLGYDWSASKGDEGIKLIRNAKGQHLTLLYDETDRNNAAKLNHLIVDNFNEGILTIPEELSPFASKARLLDMLDFSRVTFEKQIALTAKNVAVFQSKWTLEKLGDICSFEYGKPLPEDNRLPGLYPVMGSNGRVGFHKEYLVEGPVIVVGRKGSAGEVIWESENCFPIDTTFYIKLKHNDIKQLYLFQALKALNLDKLRNGSGVPGLNRNEVYQLKIPLPPLTVQQQIVTGSESIDAEVAAAQTILSNSLDDIENLIENIYSATAPMLEIDKISLLIQYGLNEAMNEANIGYKIFRMNEIIRGRMFDGSEMKYAAISDEEFTKYKLNRGDLLFNRTNSIEHVGKTGLFDLEGDYCFASYLVRVVPDTKQVLPLFLAKMMNSTSFQQEAKGKASKSINQANINATVMRNIKVPVPPLVEQEKFVSRIEALERAIADAQTIINDAPAKKQAVMNKHL